jgi:hypothetical protein
VKQVESDATKLRRTKREEAPLAAGKSRPRVYRSGDTRIANLIARSGLQDAATLHKDGNGTAFKFTYRPSSDAGRCFLVIGVYGVSNPEKNDARRVEAGELMTWVSQQATDYRCRRRERGRDQARVIVTGDFNGVENPERDRAVVPRTPR